MGITVEPKSVRLNQIIPFRYRLIMAVLIHFQPYNNRLETRIYRRNLPHWRQIGCTYFVTFRLGDSIPAPILQAWEEERRIWLAAHDINTTLSADEWKRCY